MIKKTKLISVAAAAALLLSGCGTAAPAPAESRNETSTAAATEVKATENTAAKETTAAPAEETTASAETTAAENTPVPETVCIKSAGHSDDREITSQLGSYYLENPAQSESVMFLYRPEGYDSSVKVVNYVLDESTSHVTDTTANTETLVINSDAAGLKVRSSTNSFSDKEDNDICSRVNATMFGSAAEFGSAYEIKYDDPTAVMKLANDEYERTRYIGGNDITIGYTIDAPVTVNAFICNNDGDSFAVLVDPEYMHGLPMLSEGDITFMIGDTAVTSDSLLFDGMPVEGMSLDAPYYAYAKVTLLNTHVSYSFMRGYENTCTVSDIEIIKPFSYISDLDMTNDTDILSGKDKDPEMKEVYDAIMDAKDTIYTDDTYGLVLLDLDFNRKPELIRTTAQKIGEYKTRLESEIYRIEDGKLVYIDKLFPASTTGEGGYSAYLGLSQLKDGTPAWHMTKMIPNDNSEYSDDNLDYLYTLDGDKLSEYPLFTRELVQVPGNDESEYKFYFYDEEIVPNVTMGRDPYSESEDDPADWEYYTWNGITATFGVWELFGFARAEFCESITTSYRLVSDWISGFNGVYSEETERYQVTDREFSHKIAYMVDDCYYGRNNGIDHNYWFLGAYAKPVIYLYPEEETDVSVRVDFPYGGELTCTYPDYGEGWNVTAKPDGTLYDANGDEYYCLYWEGTGAADFDTGTGFCVAGADTAAFLREKLMYIGLSAREANEFIIYWLPKLQDNPYNVITLHTDDYTRSVPLDVSPAPDTLIRVFMTYYASDTPIDVPMQELPHYKRSGFTLVEWGGSEE